MNKRQKVVLFASAVAFMLALLYPPRNFVGAGGGMKMFVGCAPLARVYEPGARDPLLISAVDPLHLFAILAGIACIACALILALRD